MCFFDVNCLRLTSFVFFWIENEINLFLGKGLLSFLQCEQKNIQFPLMTLIFYKGFLLTACSLLPIGKDTLVYGRYKKIKFHSLSLNFKIKYKRMSEKLVFIHVVLIFFLVQMQERQSIILSRSLTKLWIILAKNWIYLSTLFVDLTQLFKWLGQVILKVT